MGCNPTTSVGPEANRIVELNSFPTGRHPQKRGLADKSSRIRRAVRRFAGAAKTDFIDDPAIEMREFEPSDLTG